MELRAPGIETTTRQGWSSRRRQRGAPPCATHSWGRDGAAAPRRGEVESVVVGDLGSSPDPGCQFPASMSPKNTGEMS